ncbi:hypothetical protein LZ30DRAFT_218150 [Colletotrichum cereale]|nr:hypothetical protein LZ30DRAFT_218150 [Colletotrichum cereale]
MAGGAGRERYHVQRVCVRASVPSARALLQLVGTKCILSLCCEKPQHWIEFPTAPINLTPSMAVSSRLDSHKTSNSGYCIVEITSLLSECDSATLLSGAGFGIQSHLEMLSVANPPEPFIGTPLPPPPGSFSGDAAAKLPNCLPSCFHSLRSTYHITALV